MHGGARPQRLHPADARRGQRRRGRRPEPRRRPGQRPGHNMMQYNIMTLINLILHNII